jgi:hypothetical protein
VTTQNFGRQWSRLIKTTIAAALVLPLSACAQNAASTSSNQQAQNIEALQQAKAVDLANANRAGTDPVAEIDLYSRGLRASTDAAKLEHGFPVGQSEIARASALPIEPMSDQQRAQLIQKLADAKVLADRGASDHDDNPILAEDFIQQGHEIDRVMEDLKIGQTVPRYQIDTALQSPAFP